MVRLGEARLDKAKKEEMKLGTWQTIRRDDDLVVMSDQDVPLRVVCSADVGGDTVAILRRDAHWARNPKSYYMPATLVLALLRKEAAGWKLRWLAEAPVRMAH